MLLVVGNRSICGWSTRASTFEIASVNDTVLLAGSGPYGKYSRAQSTRRRGGPIDTEHLEPVQSVFQPAVGTRYANNRK
jgi:hypothetical protein